MRQVRTAIIGCGKVGRIHADALKSVPEAEFVAVCDSDAGRAAAFAGQYSVRPYTDMGDLLKDSGAEAVILCTPHPLHAEPAIRAAEAGVHVLVEKPLAANLADCDAMLAAADKAGVKLGVVSQRRFFEPVRRMRAAIDAGKIGRPALGTFVMLSWRDEAYYRSDPWRGRWDTEGGGVLVNQSPHQLDLLQWFMGPIEEISGRWANVNHPSVEVDDTAVAVIRFAERRPRQRGNERVAEARRLHQGPRPRLQRRLGRRADRRRRDVHRRHDRHGGTAIQRRVDGPRRGGALGRLAGGGPRTVPAHRPGDVLSRLAGSRFSASSA